MLNLAAIEFGTGRARKGAIAMLATAIGLSGFIAAGLSTQARASTLSGSWAGTTSTMTSVVDSANVTVKLTGVGNATAALSSGTLDPGVYSTAGVSGSAAATVSFTPSSLLGTAVLTFSFDEPLRDPVLHIGGLGAQIGTLGVVAGVSPLLTFAPGFSSSTGNSQFVAIGNTVTRPLLALGATSGCGGLKGEACGSLAFSGDLSSIATVITYPVGALANDAFDFVVEGARANSDLQLSTSTPTITPGGSGTQTVTVTNMGPNSAYDVVVTYVPPTGSTITTLPEGCLGLLPFGPLTCAVAPNLANGANVSLTVPLGLSAVAIPGVTLSGGVASVAQTNLLHHTDLDIANDSVVLSATAGLGSADLSVSASAPTITPGSVGNWAIAVGNAGPSNAQGPISVTVTPPTSLQIEELPVGCLGVLPLGPLTCTLPGPVAVGSNLTLNVSLRVPTDSLPGIDFLGGVVAVLSPTLDPAPLNNLAASIVTAGPRLADIAVVALTASLTPGAAGQLTLTATNNGPSDAVGPIVLSYTAPTGVDITSLPAGCAGTLPLGQISCTHSASLANGAVTSQVVPIRIPSSSLPLAIFTGGVATATSGTLDANLLNNLTLVSSTAGLGLADLSSSSTSQALAPGESGTVTITTTNGGPSDAFGPITLTYSPLSEVEVTALPSGCIGGTLIANVLTCSVVGPLVSGTSASLDVPVRAKADVLPGANIVGGTLISASMTLDPNPTNNISVPAISIAAAVSDLNIVTSTPTVNPGSNGNVTVTVSNAGPSNHTGPVTVTYTPPLGVSIVSLPAGCLGSLPTGPLTCTNNDQIVVGANYVLDVPVKVHSGALPGLGLSGGVATVSSLVADPNVLNSLAVSVVTAGTATADLAIDAVMPSLVPGASGSSTVTITNNGPSDALGPISIEFVTPLGSEIVSVPIGCTQVLPTGPLSCILPGSISSGTTQTFDIPVRVPSFGAPSNILSGGSIAANASTLDPNPLNNIKLFGATTLAGSANLLVTVSTLPATPGTTTNATLTATNSGPSTAEGPVAVSFLPPVGTGIASLPAGCIGPIPAGPITCTVATALQLGASASVDIAIDVAPSAQPLSLLTGGTAFASSATPSVPLENNVLAVSIATSAAIADLQTLVFVNPIVAGTTQDAIITITDNGPSFAIGPVVVTIVPSAGSQIVSLPPGCTGSLPSGPLTCTIVGDIAPGVPVEITVPVFLPLNTPAGPLVPGSITSASSSFDPTPLNNMTPFVVSLGSAVANVVASASSPNLAVGGTGVQTLTATNVGGSSALGPITFTYVPQPGVQITSLVSGCTEALHLGPIVCSMAGPLAPNDFVGFELPISLSTNVLGGTTLTGGTLVVTSGVPPSTSAPLQLSINVASAVTATTLTLPSTTIPATTIPITTIPITTIPVTIPITTIPVTVTIPSTIIPATTIPITTTPVTIPIPSTTIPATTIPLTIPIPSTTIPATTIPITTTTTTTTIVATITDLVSTAAGITLTEPITSTTSAPEPQRDIPIEDQSPATPDSKNPSEAPIPPGVAAKQSASPEAECIVPVAMPGKTATALTAQAGSILSIDLNLPVGSKATLSAQPCHGDLKIVRGTVVYTPTSTYAGEDSFTVTVTSADGVTSVRIMKLAVLGIEVGQPSGSAPNNLAFTGAQSLMLVAFALVLLLLGSLVTFRSCPKGEHEK